MKVGIIIDNPRRDLSGIALLSYQLWKRSITVFVIPMYEQEIDVPLLELDILIVNYVRKANLDFIKRCKKLGIKIAVLDTEGGAVPERGAGSPDSSARKFNELNAAKLIDFYFFWGEVFFHAFSQNKCLDESKLYVTGTPRTDIFNIKWQLEKPSNTNNILVNMNFPSINPWWGSYSRDQINGGVKFESLEIEARNQIAVLEMTFDEAMSQMKRRCEIFNNFIKIVAALSKRFPEFQFTVRPHPFENSIVYDEIFSGYPNIVVNSDGEVKEAIFTSRIVIHLNCSTAIEARFLDRIPVNLKFLDFDDYQKYMQIPSRVSINAESFDDVVDVISSNQNQFEQLCSENDFKKLLFPWFYSQDGNAAERISSILKEKIKVEKRVFNLLSYYHFLCSDIISIKMLNLFLGTISIFIGSYLIVATRNFIKPKRSYKYVEISELKKLIETYALCEEIHFCGTIAHAKNPFTGSKLKSLTINIISD